MASIRKVGLKIDPALLRPAQRTPAGQFLGMMRDWLMETVARLSERPHAGLANRRPLPIHKLLGQWTATYVYSHPGFISLLQTTSKLL